MTREPTGQRRAELLAWLMVAGLDRFQTELQMTTAATAEVWADGAELDFLASHWRQLKGDAMTTNAPDQAELTTDVALRADEEFALDQRRAKAYAESGYWADAKSLARALVKIEAGRSLGIPPLMAMSEVHVIEGKPELGAGALAALVKESAKYDYRITEHDATRCVVRFFDRRSGEVLGDSAYTIQDAKQADLTGRGTWQKYPRNMLFARAISNGVAWFCPDVTLGRVYVEDETEDFAPAPTPAPADPPPVVTESDIADGLAEAEDADFWPADDADEGNDQAA